MSIFVIPIFVLISGFCDYNVIISFNDTNVTDLQTDFGLVFHYLRVGADCVYLVVTDFDNMEDLHQMFAY